MKKLFYLTITLSATLLASCKKDVIQNPYDLFDKPYSTGVIKFQYQTPTFINSIATTKDTIVEFTSRGANTSEFDDYGYNKASTPWAQILRLNPNNYSNSTGIFFVGTDLDSLTLPYKFQSINTSSYAYINYVLGYKSIIDSVGNLSYVGNTYLGTTTSSNFELTILSKVNNRLQGTFDAEIKKQDGLLIQVKNGLFDIEIVDR